MSLRSRRAPGWWLLELCCLLACGRAGEVHTEPLELARGPLPRTAPPTAPAADPPPVALPAPDVMGDTPEVDARRADVQAWLERECSSCHGVPAGPDARYDDIDVLTRDRWLWPGAGEVSPVVLWLQYGSNRREHAGVQVSRDEFDTLVSYVNELEPASACPGLIPGSRDRAYEVMALDLSTREPAERPFIRYVDYSRANEQGSCDRTIERAAFAQLLNSVSLSATIVPPGALATSDPFGSDVHPIDIRDYGWMAPIDVGGPEGVHFDDRWSAIVAAVKPDALELAGPEADYLKRETGAAIPVLRATQFVAAAAVGALYSALVGAGDGVSALAASLGVEDGSAWRAGAFGAAPLPDRVVTRREQSAFPEHSWWTREELWAVDGAGGLADDPVRYPNEGAEVIFTLPNGLFAFAVAASDGSSVHEIPGCLGGVRCPSAVRAENSVTCRACHETGLQGVSDEVLPYLEADPASYSPELEPLIRQQYRPGLWLAQDADDAVNAAAVLEATGAPSTSVIALLYFEATRHRVDAVRAADELGVTIDQLRGAVELLGSEAPELAPLLSNGKVGRDQLHPHLEWLACNIAGLRNRPVRCQ